MKVFMLFTGSGPIVILTSHDSIDNPELLGKLTAKGIGKFLAFEISIDLAKERYGAHFDLVCQDLSETDDLRMLDYNGERAWRLFQFSELGEESRHEPPPGT